MQSVDELLGRVPVFAGLAAEHRATISACGRNQVFEPDAYLMREGDPAELFFVIRQGTATLETFVPQRGAVTLQTLHDGDLLGWSWLFPPYRTAFDARALDTVHALQFDGTCLREKCDSDPSLGYEVLKLFAAVIIQRLQHTRVQLLDLYAESPAPTPIRP